MYQWCVLSSVSCSINFYQDTEFPGVVARPVGTFTSSADHRYQTLRCNVDLLRIIQLGLLFMQSFWSLISLRAHFYGFPRQFTGWNLYLAIQFLIFVKVSVPMSICLTFFNSEDMYAQDSIDLLKRSGIDFKRHESNGIDVDVISSHGLFY